MSRVQAARWLGFSMALVVAVAACRSTPAPAESTAPPAPGTTQVTVHEGTSMAAALSPDGRTLAIDAQGAIWTLPATGGPARRITDELSDARQPAWSADGTQIAFQSFRSGDWDIWVIGRDGGEARQLTSGPFDDREPHWSPDGASIAFSSDRSGNYDIWQVAVGGSEPKQVTRQTTDEFFPAWSPDGREIAYASSRGPASGIYASTLQGDERRIAVVGQEGSLGAPSWSPDGAQVLFSVTARGEGRLMLGERELASGEDVFPFRAQWTSPNEFVYTADGRIKRRSVGAPTAQPIEFSVTFSLARTPYQQRRRDFDNPAERPVRGIVRPVVSPDGTRVAFAALGDLWVTTAGGPPMQVTDDPFVESDPDWSPDGRQLVFASDRAGGMDLWVMDLQKKAARRLTSAPTSELLPSWSPDGRRIAFVAIEGLFTGPINVVDVQTGAVRQVHESLFGPSELSWSPDSRLLMFSSLKRYSGRFREGLNQFVTLQVDGGEQASYTVRPHRGSDVRAGGGPVWSPDGRRVAFVMEGALHVMPVDASGMPSGEPVRITDEIAHSPSWTGDSARLVYLSSERLRTVSADGGAPADVPLALTYAPKLPTGRLVVHAGRLIDGTDAAPRTNVDIIVEGHRIAAIEAHQDARHQGHVVDGSALTVLPGLIEMHGHMVKEYGEAMGRAWLAYGVTTIRNPAAMTPYMSLEDREAIEAGVRVGPRVYASGYQMDGSRIYYPLGLSISSPAQLEWELERTTRLDLDFIKTYVRLPDAFQKRVIEFAHANGLPVTSHEIYPAVAMGADGTEHTSGTSRRGYSPKISQNQFAYEDVVQLIARSGMQFTPTASLGNGFQALTRQYPDMLADPRYRRLFPAWIVEPAPSARRGGGGPGGNVAEPRGAKMAAAILAAGGTVLAGTDSPITPYGLSLQAELEVLVSGGLTPLQAIQTATLHAARALNASDDLGAVQAGKLADFFMVEGDPLTTIADSRRVRTVVKNGEVYEVSALVSGSAPTSTAAKR